ncbi:MAG: glycosyltransferase family 2 protein [Chloroflexi bacterium]|nr:glycosyltransferase family 2 protein [Chloroflexota bacterium]
MSYQLISIILPVYNQANHIASVIEEYETALAKIPVPHELLLVVNGSRDNSLEVCDELTKKYAEVRVINEKAGGWGLAVRRGLQEAQGDLLCYTNSARTRGQDLTLMLLYAVAYPDVVIKANRKIRESWRRRLGSLLYNLECRALFDLSFWDINGTPKVFPRKFNQLLSLHESGDLIDAEFNVICRRQDYHMIEVPIFSAKRHGGKSTTNYGSAFRMYWGVYQLWRNLREGNR